MRKNNKSKYGNVIENCYADPIDDKCFGGDDVAIKKAAEKAAKKTVKTWNNSSTEHHDLIYTEVNSPEKLTDREKREKLEKHGYEKNGKIKKDYAPNKDTNVQSAISSILLPNKNGLALVVVCNASSPQGSKLVCPKNLTWQKQNPNNPQKSLASNGTGPTKNLNKKSILPPRSQNKRNKVKKPLSELPPGEREKLKRIREEVKKTRKGGGGGGIGGRG